MLLSSGDAGKRGCYIDETSEDRRRFWTLAARDAAGGNDCARRGTSRRLGPRFVLALRSSARTVAGTRRGRDALAPRLTHLSRMKLGPSVLLLNLRHPLMVAKSFASLDYLSNGRMVMA